MFFYDMPGFLSMLSLALLMGANVAEVFVAPARGWGSCDVQRIFARTYADIGSLYTPLHLKIGLDVSEVRNSQWKVRLSLESRSFLTRSWTLQASSCELGVRRAALKLSFILDSGIFAQAARLERRAAAVQGAQLLGDALAQRASDVLNLDVPEAVFPPASEEAEPPQVPSDIQPPESTRPEVMTVPTAPTLVQTKVPVRQHEAPVETGEILARRRSGKGRVTESTIYGAVGGSMAVVGLVLVAQASRQSERRLPDQAIVDRKLIYYSGGAFLLGASFGASVGAVVRRFSDERTPLRALLGVGATTCALGTTLALLTSSRLRQIAVSEDPQWYPAGRVAGASLAGLGMALVVTTATSLLSDHLASRPSSRVRRRARRAL